MSALRDQRREETRRRLYEAALDAFRREDFATCRIDDIARAAGVSRGSFYFHYPTKDDVLLEYMHETEFVIADAVDALPPDASICDLLDTFCAAFAKIWQDDARLLPEVVAVGLRFTANAVTDNQAGRLRHMLAQRFLAAAERGELTSLLPPQILSDLYLGHTVAGLLAWYGHQETPLEIVLQSTTKLFFHGAQTTIHKPEAPAKKAVQRKPARRKS